MLKRFMLGFLIGIGAMYWYLQDSGAAVDDARNWADTSASNYRADSHKQAADRELNEH